MSQKERDCLEGNEQLMLGLLENNEALALNGNIFESALEKNRNDEELTQEEQNVVTWWESLNNSYPGDSKSKRDFVYRDFRDSNIIEEIENQEYHGLKKAIEVMLKDVVNLYLKAESSGTAEVFLTSDYDDIKSGIDVIVASQKGDTTEYLGIDFVVSKKLSTIRKKGNRKSTNPKEFSHHMGKRIEMKRIVKDFNPRIVGILFNHFLIQIIKGKDPSQNIDTLYEQAKTYVSNIKGPETIRTQHSLKKIVEEVLAQ